jgi:octaheme c-type cytochrome (tetrathionate reductase family)
VDNCAAGLDCQDGLCVEASQLACEPACADCQMCDTSGAAPVCVELCAAGLVCNAGVCEAPVCEPVCGPCQLCDLSGAAPSCLNLCSAEQFCDAGVCRRDGVHAHLSALDGPFADGPAVTAACLTCHPDEGAQMLGSLHFNWLTTNHAIEPAPADPLVGKANLINNFCIAVASNEKRCTQCHAGYGWENPSFDFSNPGNIDCLVCHADPASGYAKDPKTAGRPVAGTDLVAAARSVGRTTRANCGACHFGAGGGDNVKKGDIGSALAHPSAETDVHMGNAFTCADCHRGDNHALLGLGVHMPVSEGRVRCEDCHTSAPHTGGQAATLNNHALDVACQTCHVPAFSRQQPTKMDWDWSTAGNKTIGTDGVETGTLPDGTVVRVYDFMKGNFVWQKSVRPAYAWYDGRSARMTVLDQHDAAQGSAADVPVELGRPVASKADPAAVIFPFKVMTGRQPGHLIGDYAIVPKLFGPGGFWAGIPDAASYTPQGVRDLWTATLTPGALAAGQIAAGDSIADADWGWIYTELYLGINHEVAPRAQALGCMDCHADNPGFSFTDLGYSCDPMGDPAGCGSRHFN